MRECEASKMYPTPLRAVNKNCSASSAPIGCARVGGGTVRRPAVWIVALVTGMALLAGLACSGGDDGGPTATAAPNGSPTVRSGLDPTEEALLASLSGLGQYVLTTSDAPPGFRLRSSSPVAKREAAVANVAIRPLASFINGSDLQGVWATLMTRENPESGLSSLIYAFETPASAQSFVQTLAGLQQTDYPDAASVDKVQSEKIGDAAQMMAYRLGSGTAVSARTLEYTWAQGRFAGQVIVRDAGDVNNPADVALLVSLAKLQSERMQQLPQ